MLRNLIYFSISIIVFFCGMILYGLMLNIREVTLEEAMQQKGIAKLSDVQLVISRYNYTMNLFSDTTLVKSYKVVFGQGSGKVKTSVFDNVTPLGTYNVCRMDDNHEFYKKIFLNYPTERDAAEALKNGTITKVEYQLIVSNDGDCPPSETRLGASIGIHGIGEYNFIFKNLPFAFNWTNGSIAVSNENIDELFEVVSLNTVVEIRD